MRIRTIKPEFWTSADIAGLPDDTHRLLFIGLWNYVDDEGRGVDDPRLIKAALFPLSDVIRPADIDTMLWRLPSVFRYSSSERRYLAITTWSQHQTISHPRPSKYPDPDSGEASRKAPGMFAEGSGLEVEQGTGNREQGMVPATVVAAERTETQRGNDLATAYHDIVPLSNFPAIAAIARKAIKAGYPEDEIRAGLLRLADDGRSVTTETLRIEIEGLPERKTRQPDRAAEIALGAMQHG